MQAHESDWFLVPSLSDMLSWLISMPVAVLTWFRACLPDTVAVVLSWMYMFIAEVSAWLVVLGDTTVPSYAVFKSTSFAWTFYIVNVLLAHSRVDEVVRLKVLVVPVFVLYLTLHALPQWIVTATVTVIVWSVIAIAMDVREMQARMRDEDVLRRIRQQRPQVEPGYLPPETLPDRVFDSNDCIICGELYQDEPLKVKYTQPCGHVLHKACLQMWFASSRQDLCPICRQSCSPSNTQIAMQIIF